MNAETELSNKIVQTDEEVERLVGFLHAATQSPRSGRSPKSEFRIVALIGLGARILAREAHRQDRRRYRPERLSRHRKTFAVA